jgi:hypothetical protein
MVLGLSLETFTIVHVIISLVAIVSGLVVLVRMVGGGTAGGLNGLFLVTTILTSVTGFFFPFRGFGPSYIVGVLSLVVLAVALFALYGRRLAGVWRALYADCAAIALYLNVFVLVAQAFGKVPALKALAPTQSEPPFAVAQAVVLVVFVVAGFLAQRRFRRA